MLYKWFRYFFFNFNLEKKKKPNKRIVKLAQHAQPDGQKALIGVGFC